MDSRAPRHQPHVNKPHMENKDHGKLWHRSRSEQGPDLKLFKVRYDWMVNPRNQHEEKMVVLEGGDAVQVIAETKAGKILLVQQYRFGVNKLLDELPGGLIDKGETPIEAARRELEEETGYKANHWQALGNNPANPVFMSGHIHHYFASDLEYFGVPRQDEGEDISLILLDKSEVKRRLLAGEFRHPHTVCGLLAYFSVKGFD